MWIDPNNVYKDMEGWSTVDQQSEFLLQRNPDRLTSYRIVVNTGENRLNLN
jgi:hypothetical protein